MRTRSQSRNNFPQQEASPAIVEPLHIELLFLEDQFQEDPPEDPPEVPMANNRTMAELLQAPTEGYEDAIVISEIAAKNFELKHGLINLVQNKQFFGHDKEDPHAHIRYFNKITSMMRVPNVPSSSIKLMLFPFSLEGAARIWFEKEPTRSILTWDDLVTKFINQFFPPSKTTNLRNEFTRFQQRFDESFYEAWDRFNDLLRACPHHGFSDLHQLDTFYNALNVNDQDSLNSAAGGNFLDKIPRECLKIIESKYKVRQSRAKAVISKVSTSSSTPTISSEVAELKDMVRALLLDKKNQSSAPTQSLTHAPVKAEGLSLPEFTSTYMTLELADHSVSKPIGIAKDVSLKVGVFHFPADFVVVDFEPDPRVLLILGRCFFKTGRALIDVHKEYSQEVLGFFDVTASGNPTPHDDLIIFTTSPTLTPFGDSDFLLFEEADAFLELGDEEKSALIKALKSHKRAIAWKLSDIQGINPEFCTHKILMEEDYKPAVQHQRRVNPKIHDVIKKEVEKLLDAGLIYPISDSPRVSPVHCVPKKGGFTVVENEENELILTRLVTGWQVCIDYRKLNEATRKVHFPLLFMDQMLERLAGNEYYCFLDGFSGYFQIPIDPRDQEKITCMLAIFHDMVEKTMEVFMDDFSVFGNSFENCLTRLDKMLQRCKDTNLCLNWEKSHFMVKEGIVLGHKISKNEIEVDRDKVDVIAKLPHPTTVKGCCLLRTHNSYSIQTRNR
nr:reverse transcriptase domain-containing protein [Tanacetum cinerariifolium]